MLIKGIVAYWLKKRSPRDYNVYLNVTQKENLQDVLLNICVFPCTLRLD